MNPEHCLSTVGCLVIDDFMSGGNMLSGLSSFLSERGVAAAGFAQPLGEPLHRSLQLAYQQVRGLDCVSGIVALGSGCDAAMAIAGQLPVDRLVLIDAVRREPGAGLNSTSRREFRRLRSFARRNAAFCVADVLAVQSRDSADCMGVEALRRLLCNSRVCGVTARDLWTNRKEQLKKELYRFLCDGVLPKSLAENPEMCIIYE